MAMKPKRKKKPTKIKHHISCMFNTVINEDIPCDCGVNKWNGCCDAWEHWLDNITAKEIKGIANNRFNKILREL